MPDQNSSLTSVLKNRGFLNLWINQILVQLSYNSLNFALIIWVFRLTDSNTAVSALLFTIYLPAVLFGLFAGVLVDLVDRKKIIMWVNLLLAVLYFSLIFFKDSYPAILAIAFLINLLGQIYSPAEASAIPLIVKKDQLLTANSIFSTTLNACFLLGFGLAGPIISFFKINTIFAFEGILLLIAFILAFRFPPITNQSDESGKKLLLAIKNQHYSIVKSQLFIEIKRTLNLIRGNLPVLSSLLILAGVQVVIGILAVLIPSFFERVVQIHATDASYILILPLGLGMVSGAYFISKFSSRLAKRTIVGRGIFTAGILFFLVGISPLIIPVIHHFPRPRPLPFFYQPPLSSILALGSFLLGMAMVSIIVPSQTVLQENTPESDRGKVFSVLAVVMQGLSLIPVLLVGGLADIFGTMPIFIALGGAILLVGIFALKPEFYFDRHHLPHHMLEFLGLGHWEK